MKRFIDIFLGLILLAILSPLLLIVSLIIKVDSRGPALFTQRRIGRNNKEFVFYKFRTMRTDAPNVATHLLKDPQSYITPFGSFLRKTSIDELPQLLNIIKGDMTVGDRKEMRPESLCRCGFRLIQVIQRFSDVIWRVNKKVSNCIGILNFDCPFYINKVTLHLK